MRRLMLMGVGGAVGYVLGARAGRPAYDRMMANARRMAESTGLTRAAETMTNAAQDLGDAGLQRANDTVAPMGQQVADAMGQVSDRLRDGGSTDGIDVSDGTVRTSAGSGLED